MREAFHNYALRLDGAVEKAVRDRRPIVAMDSAWIAGVDVEKIGATLIEMCAQANVALAFMAMIDGEIVVGGDIDKMTTGILTTGADNARYESIELRDIAPAISEKRSGAMTVSAAVRIAALVGIEVVCTTAIGASHSASADKISDSTDAISADAHILSQQRVAIICAGMGAQTDIAVHMKYLAAHSVPVIAHRCDGISYFATESTTHRVRERMDRAQDIAQCARIAWALETAHGMLIVTPHPSSYSSPALMHQIAVEQNCAFGINMAINLRNIANREQ